LSRLDGPHLDLAQPGTSSLIIKLNRTIAKLEKEKSKMGQKLEKTEAELAETKQVLNVSLKVTYFLSIR
jgi:hypothetical protein